ncbi:plasmodium falciparum CPW-WPC domain-containing protein, putative [Eimeria necatrix]|uniref:Plasmodium falciparum CPW-WPC domain-containing protein, putative n=1 Tax=Eimeria necatrix TaxID=51315 RepID=U6N166_9EIME|nr:plasmodium falciparum CPW-WPC domain-containing protein, putative [Eimeria necatrix]CDJ68509.1 plasmodium falciparum CPW-WPC domain-containing protein, putative [Eimeria necatrix]
MAAKEKRIAELSSECEGELEGWIAFGSAAAQQQQQQQQPLPGYDLLLLEEELQQKDKNFDKLLLAAALQQQNFCSRNYKTLCPFAWTPVGTGGFCEAPRAYIGGEGDGICQAPFDYSGPCETSCDRDYSAPCPEGWNLVGLPKP